MNRALFFFSIFGLLLLLSSCSGFQTTSPPSKNAPQQTADQPVKRRSGQEKTEASTGSASWLSADTTAHAQEKVAALTVLYTYLEAVAAGGTGANWGLSTEAFHSAVLKDFPPEEQTEQKFLEYLKEGIAHERLLSYTIRETNIYRDQALISIDAQRSDIDGATFASTDTFKLVKENGQWKVDGTFKPF